MRSLVVITAGLSQPSTTRNLADQLSSAVEAAISSRGEAAEVTTIELREIALDLAKSLGGTTPPAVEEIMRKISAADGIIAVSPAFKASYSGLFKMFFDLLDQDALIDMPVVIGATGGSVRHALILEYAMRPLFAYLRANVMPTAVFAATDDFGGDNPEARDMEVRVQHAARELATAMLAETTGVGGLGGATADQGTGRHRNSGVDIPSTVTSFSNLLKGHDGV